MVPTQQDAKAALDDLACMMRGESRGKSGRYKAPVFDVFVRHWLEEMRTLLSLYTCEKSSTFNQWGKSAVQAAIALGLPSKFCACTLSRLSRAYILDRTIIPVNPYGRWKKSMLMDEDVMSDVKEYLQELGTKITAEKLTTFLSSPEFMEKHGTRKKYTIHTAQRYLHYLGYQFQHQRKGQYVDGHDREEVVTVLKR
ncbi:hypothetical protein PQX77_019095 [Marasmius sp. AFHP31]|nr:hypothetical protein PQX77_019095 [Marasmius sp. AFHP31]